MYYVTKKKKKLSILKMYKKIKKLKYKAKTSFGVQMRFVVY